MRARPESSTIWRESFFVLTEPGRLHSFDSERALEPRGTLPVRGGTTAPNDTPCGFAIVGLGKALLFRCDSEEEVRARGGARGGGAAAGRQICPVCPAMQLPRQALGRKMRECRTR
jgi:hypothetical protein